MKAYIAKHSLNSCISVEAIFTIYHNIDMHKRKPRPESHDFPELAYVSEAIGEHRFVLDGKAYSMKKGDVFIIPPNVKHCALPFSKSTVDMISFEIKGDISPIYQKSIKLNGKQEQMFLELINEGARLFVGKPLPDYEKGVSLHQRTNEFLLQKFKNHFEIFLLDLYLSETEPEFSASDRSSEAEFDRIIAYMKDNVNKKLSLADISSRYSLSATKIQRIFYKHAGCAPMQYFIEMKLGAAKKLMLSTSMNTSDIARALDFSSVNYFSRLFKQKNGINPSEYVKSIRNTKEELK